MPSIGLKGSIKKNKTQKKKLNINEVKRRILAKHNK
jgi:hypothetical protein